MDTDDKFKLETNAERRRRKLKDFCAENGGHVKVAEKAELSAATLLQYINANKSSHAPKAGGRSPSERGMGDAAARAIEEAFGLERGWFDNEIDTMIRTAQEQELLAIFRQFPEDRRRATVQVLREQISELEREAELLAERLRRAAKVPPQERVRNLDSDFGSLHSSAPAAVAKRKRST